MIHWINNHIKTTVVLIFESSRWDQKDDLISPFFQPLILTVLSFIFVVNITHIESALIHTVVFAGTIYFIFYSNETKPIILALFASPAVLLIFRYNDLMGIAFFVLLTLYFMYSHVHSTSRSTLMWMSSGVFLFAVFIHSLFMSPLVGSDERNFYSRVAEFDSSFVYLQYLKDLLLADPARIQNSIETFAIIYLPFYDLFNIHSPRLIIILNIALWILTALLFRELLIGYSDRVGDVSPNFVFAVLLLSPTAIYWSSTFAKDITSTFLCMATAYLFFRKKTFLFMIVLIFATMIRPYSLAIIAIYISVIMWSQLLLMTGLLLSIVAVLFLTGEPITLINSVLVFVYLFISPNPLRAINWASPEILLRTLEGLVYGVVLVISVLYSIVNEEMRNHYILLGSALGVFSLALILIGYTLTFSDGQYTIGSIGTNVFRRMVPMLPILAFWVSITISQTPIPKVILRK